MESSRLGALQSMLAADPGNRFVRYGLAMEFMKTNDLEGAVAEFRELIARDRDYAAAYFQCGQAFEKMHRVSDAREMYTQGIAASSRIGDAHTASELQAALDLIS